MDNDGAGLTVNLEDDSPIADAQAHISAALEPTDVGGFVRVYQQVVQGVGERLRTGGSSLRISRRAGAVMTSCQASDSVKAVEELLKRDRTARAVVGA